MMVSRLLGTPIDVIPQRFICKTGLDAQRKVSLGSEEPVSTLETLAATIKENRGVPNFILKVRTFIDVDICGRTASVRAANLPALSLAHQVKGWACFEFVSNILLMR